MSSDTTTLSDASEVPRGTGSLSALSPERQPSASDFVSAALPEMSSFQKAAEGVASLSVNFANGLIGSVSPFLAAQSESEGERFRHPGSIPQEQRFKASELEAAYKANYLDANGNKTASSRTTPAAPVSDVPVGSWRTEDRYKGNYGHDLSQLAWLDPHKLEVSEHEIGSAWGQDRREDAERYAGWMKDGKQAPPIEVVETDNGKLKVSDGHRRHHAAKLTGQQILAWVSPNADTGKRTPDGKPITTALTEQLAAKDWDEQQQRRQSPQPKGFARGGKVGDTLTANHAPNIGDAVEAGASEIAKSSSKHGEHGFKILDVVDTRQYVEDGDDFIPVPGSGAENECARCGKPHEIHYHVQDLATKEAMIVGGTCAKASGMLGGSKASSFESAAKAAKRLQSEIAALSDKRSAFEAARQEIVKSERPPITSEPVADKDLTIHRMGDAMAWQHDRQPINDERRQTLESGWIDRRLQERGFTGSSGHNFSSRIADAEKKLGKTRARMAELTELANAHAEEPTGFATGGHASYGAATQPPAASDVIPAMLTPGEVVLTEEQQRDVAEQAGKTPAEMFGGAKVPGFEPQPTQKPKTRRERFTRAIGAAAEVLGFSKGGKVPGASVGVGDMVQWTINGSEQFTEPRKVSQVMGEFAFVEGATTGLPVSQLHVHSKADNPAKSKVGKSASQHQADPEWTAQIEAAIEAQDVNRRHGESGKPSRDRAQNIAKGIEAEGGILLSAALPLIADERTPRERVIQDRGLSSGPDAPPMPKDEVEAARKVEAIRRQRQEEQPTRPKTTPFSDTLAERLLGRPAKQPTTTLPIGQAASFPRDVAPPTPQRTGLVDPNPGPPPLPKGLDVAGMKWTDMPREVQALIAAQQPELARQLQSGQPPAPQSTQPTTPARDQSPTLPVTLPTAPLIQSRPERDDGAETYPLPQPPTRQQRSDDKARNAARIHAEVVAGLLDDGTPKPVEKPVSTYEVKSPDLPTLERDNDPYPLAGRKPVEAPNAAVHRESGPVGKKATAPTENIADWIYAAGGMVGGRTGAAARVVGQFLGAKPRSRETWTSRALRYATGGFFGGGGNGGGNGGGGDGPRPPGSSDEDSGNDPISGGSNVRGRFGNAITSGLSAGGVIHVWVDGGQIKIDDAACGRGPSGGGATSGRTSRTSSSPVSAAESGSVNDPDEQRNLTPIPRSRRRTRERPVTPRIPDDEKTWLGRLTGGLRRKARGVRSVGKRLLRFARGAGGRPAFAGATGRMAGGIAGGLGRAAMTGMGSVAAGSIVGGIASGGAAGGAALGAGAALVAGTGPIGMAMAAAAGLAAGLVAAAVGLVKWSEHIAESNRVLGKYNGAIAASFANLDNSRVYRAQSLGAATQGSTTELTGALDKFEQALLPLEQMLGTLTNVIGTQILNEATELVAVLNYILVPLRLIARMVDKPDPNGGHDLIAEQAARMAGIDPKLAPRVQAPPVDPVIDLTPRGKAIKDLILGPWLGPLFDRMNQPQGIDPNLKQRQAGGGGVGPVI